MKRLVLVAVCALPLFAQNSGGISDRQRRLLVDFGGLTVYGSDNTELDPPAPGENRVIFFGDTVTAEWAKHGFDQAFPGKSFLNRGIEDQTTPQMLIRFRQDVIDLKPAIVVIQGGSNDFANYTGPGSEGTIRDNLMSMIELAKLHGIKVILASMTPVCDCYENQTQRRPIGKINSINAGYRGLAEQYGITYLNYNTQLVDENRYFKKELTSDGYLPNEAGYKLMAEAAKKAIADTLSTK